MSSTSTHFHDDDSKNPSGSSIPASLRNWFSNQSAIAASERNGRSISPSFDSSSDDTSAWHSRCGKTDQGKKSRFVGVRQRKSGKWVAEIREKSKKTRHWLGTFNTEEEAARAYDVEAKRIRGPNTRLNFPSQSSQNEVQYYSELLSVDHKTEQNFQNNQSNEEPRKPEQIHDFTELLTHLELNNEYPQEDQFQDRIYEHLFQLSPLCKIPSPRWLSDSQSRMFSPFQFDIGDDPVFHLQHPVEEQFEMQVWNLDA